MAGTLAPAVRRERLLGVIRLSNETEESTSPERQTEHIKAIAAYREAVIVGYAIDMDVSGRYVAPWDRAELGDWMANRVDEYDGYASWKMDRLTRKPLHFYLLMERCDAEKKIIVTRSDGIDTSTTTGRRSAELMAMVGSWEWEAIQERNEETRAFLVKTPRFTGGRVPFGYEKYKTENGWLLRHNVEQVKTLRRMYMWFTEFHWSFNRVADRLNDLGVPTALVANHGTGARKKLNKDQWQATTVRRMMLSRILLGERVFKGERVLDKDGRPVMIGPPIFSESEWQTLQEALPRKEGHSNTARFGGTWLLHILHCAICGSPMYSRVSGTKESVYRYYRCNSFATKTNCPNSQVDLYQVETYVEETLLSTIGDKPYRKRTVNPAADHTEELEQHKASLLQLMENLNNAQSNTVREFIGNQIAGLDARITELEKNPHVPRSVSYEETGQTWGEHWKALNREEQATLLRSVGVKAYALRWPGSLSIPARQPSWPTATLGDQTYALGDKGNKRGGEPMYYISLGDEADLLDAMG